MILSQSGMMILSHSVSLHGQSGQNEKYGLTFTYTKKNVRI